MYCLKWKLFTFTNVIDGRSIVWNSVSHLSMSAQSQMMDVSVFCLIFERNCFHWLLLVLWKEAPMIKPIIALICHTGKKMFTLLIFSDNISKMTIFMHRVIEVTKKIACVWTMKIIANLVAKGSTPPPPPTSRKIIQEIDGRQRQTPKFNVCCYRKVFIQWFGN